MRFEQTEVRRAPREEVRSFAAAGTGAIAGGPNALHRSALADALYDGHPGGHHL